MTQKVGPGPVPCFRARLAALWIALLYGFAPFTAPGQETWQTALGHMPLGTNTTSLTSTNYARIMLGAFRSNTMVKALVFMPGAVDVFFWNRQAKVALTNDHPTLLDAVNALTNQTGIRATFCAPMLLLHGNLDPVEPLAKIKDPATADRIKQRRLQPHALYDDLDWDSMLPILKKTCGVSVFPKKYSKYAFHFYRSTFAAWNLTAWETLEAASLSGKTTFTVEKKQVVFQGDDRRK